MTEITAQIEEATKRVFEHHLGAFAQGLDAILSDYDETSVLVTPQQVYRGLDEIRGFFKGFLDGADPAFWPAFKIVSQCVAREVAYFAWEAKPWVTLATDTLVIRNGKISVQTFTSLSA
ncbi:nuclear transport factor 2 family protein [Paraburkholderia pallida]|uniref:Nuclear transport factor 2 family protein n=1 Tax=Paraburkholderia pallida TaxID=2547399 RepID=A0A4P7D3T1_9BURK|nr:nuclear transport factor 2 family protein [Paraburkholderia pallida]QBR01385.1 nuclear transport factor 2 family protein [Paraburkholderia pallida]